MGLLVNLDNGGTFTDVCVSDGSRVVHTKTATTPHDLTRCFTDGLRLASKALYGEEDLAKLLHETDYLRYSTTSGSNAMLERKGTSVGLLVAAGSEADAYGAVDTVDADLWQAMVPAKPAGVQITKDGRIDELALVASVNDLVADGVGRIVVSLPSQEAERLVKSVLLERYPRHMLGAIPFMLSHELVNDEDDARRTMTVVVNSYLHPGMEHFLYGAQAACSSNGLARPLLIFRNDGDSARIAKTAAIKTWGSGPRGGLEGAQAYASRYTAKVLVTMDVGGTTTDVAVLVNGEVGVRATGLVDVAPISFALPELRSLGLGGSSIIRVRPGVGGPHDQITVGPESVGAAPGPASFGRGGTEATLTDALLLAGVLDSERYLGGTLSLDATRAFNAIENHVAHPLGIEVADAALAILAAFYKQVGAEISTVLNESGVTADDATLLAFGGGGPLIATGVAKSCGIPRVIVPELAAVFSAFGMGFSDLAHEYTSPMGGNAEETASIREQLVARARRDMYGEGVDPDGCEYITAIRTVNDGRLVDVIVDGDDLSSSDGELCVRAVHSLPRFELGIDEPLSATAPTVEKSKPVGGQDTKVYDADNLITGDRFSGPALVAGDYLTCLVGADWNARISSNSDLILEH